MLNQGQVYETIVDVYPTFRDHVISNAIESDSMSLQAKNIPSDANEISTNLSQALTTTVQQEKEHKTPDHDETYEVPALCEEFSGNAELDLERFKGRNTRDDNTDQKLLKQESHDHESYKMSKVKADLSDYEELNQCRREVEDHNVYQKLLKT